MKLRKNLNSLSALSLEVPALSEDKEGLLKGGFCAVATMAGMGLQSENVGNCNDQCNKACQSTCQESTCVDQTCNDGCNVGCVFDCKDSCQTKCETTKPEGGGDTTKAVSSGMALFGFSLVF